MRAIPTVSIAILILSGARAQSPAARPQFEVASIKPGGSGSPVRFNPLPGGLLRVEGMTLQRLMENAYGIESFQIRGAPAWMSSDKWDIAAKAEGNRSTKELMSMLQALLEARFHLTLHRETKEFSAYALAVGKGSLKLSNAKDAACDAPDAALPLSPDQAKTAGHPAPSLCGRIAEVLEIWGERRIGRLRGKNVNTAELARVIEVMLGRPVVEKTGFKGTFDIDLEYAPEPNSIPDEIEKHSGASEPGGSAPTLDADGASIFGALQQLGLKLESAKGPVEVLVIDHVEKPDQN
jgi:uncharacterized protein (TIGR03435 family)